MYISQQSRQNGLDEEVPSTDDYIYVKRADSFFHPLGFRSCLTDLFFAASLAALSFSSACLSLTTFATWASLAAFLCCFSISKTLDLLELAHKFTA